jgi:pimeloyl-ACP methyl ester carboxylesterase
MPFVSARGVRFHFEDQGEGPTILVAHGLFGSIAESSRASFPAAQLGAAGFRIVQYDARGHGSSEGPCRPRDFHWRQLALDMDGVLGGLGIERAVILGTSMGAGTALMLALTKPERVEALVLRHPPPFGSDLLPVRLRMAGLAAAFQVLGVKKAAALLGGDSAERQQLFESQQPDMVLPAVRGLLFARPQLAAEPLHRITARTLVLVHPGDVEHPLSSGDFLRERLPHAEVREAPERGYWRSQPEALTREIVSFLRRPAG